MKLRDLSIIEPILPKDMSFAKLLRESERMARAEGKVLLVPLFFPIAEDPGKGQPAGCLLLKLLRFNGDRRACVITYSKDQAGKVKSALNDDRCGILLTTGSHLMGVDEFKEMLEPDAMDVLARHTFQGSLFSHIVEDLRMTDMHASLGLVGLKQACDALSLCDAPPALVTGLHKSIRQSPESLFRVRYTTARTEIASQLDVAGRALRKEATALTDLLSTVRAGLKGKQVMVVEDDTLWTDLLNHLLKEHRGPSPTEVIAYGTDKSMLDRISKALQDPEHNIGLCIVDLRLRPTSGNKNTWRKVLQCIRQLDKGVPILVLSASRDPQDRQDAMGLDADAFFTKHMDVSPLQAFVTHELERRSIRHLHSLLALIGRLTNAQMFIMLRWARALREAQATGTDYWWRGWTYTYDYQHWSTGEIKPAKHKVKLADREVFGLFEESVVRYRHALIGQGPGGDDEITLRFQSLVRANFIAALGSLIERVHSRNTARSQRGMTEQLGTYDSDGDPPVRLGKGDYLAQHLYYMRHAASHYGGMVRCGDREWQTFFAGMFIWLLGLPNGAFPWFSELDHSAVQVTWTDPWSMIKPGDLSDRLLELIRQDTDLGRLCDRLYSIDDRPSA